MANDFSGDTSCKALWRFEPGALLSDSVGGNTLSNYTTYSDDAASETTIKAEGSGSVSLVRDQWLILNDADMDSGFPTKTGDTANVFSFAGWFRYNTGQTITANRGCLARRAVDGGSYSFHIGLKAGFTEYWIGWHYSGFSSENYYTSGAGLAADQWFHVGVSIDGVNKTVLIRTYDPSTDTAQTFSNNFTNALTLGNGGTLALGYYLLGFLDEAVVFDEVKTASDFDAIRAGSYPPTILSVANAHHIHSAETPFMGTLDVANAAHALWSPQIWAIDLVVNDAYHVTTSPNLERVLLVEDAYHAMASDNLDLAQVYGYATTAQTDGGYPILPDMRLSGQAGERIVSITGGMRLPGLTLSARTGTRVSEKLPALECSASGVEIGVMRLTRKLPVLSGQGQFGSRTGTLKLPALNISVAVSGDLWGSLTKTLPGMTLSAAMDTNGYGSLSKDLPPLDIEASGSIEGGAYGILDKKLPALTISAIASLDEHGSLKRSLPGLKITAAGYGDGMSLDALLPTLIMQPVSTGAGDGQIGVLSDDSRFDGYVLRHVR